MDKFLNSEVFLVNLDICPLNFSVGQVQTSEMNLCSVFDNLDQNIGKWRSLAIISWSIRDPLFLSIGQYARSPMGSLRVREILCDLNNRRIHWWGWVSNVFDAWLQLYNLKWLVNAVIWLAICTSIMYWRCSWASSKLGASPVKLAYRCHVSKQIRDSPTSRYVCWIR